MTKPFFLGLFEYNSFMNQQLAEMFAAKTDLPERSIKLFWHILNSHHIWNCRINGQVSDFTVWQSHPGSDLKFIDRTNFEISGIILDNTAMDKTIRYASSQGDNYTNKVEDILFHVINHSTY